MSGNAESLALLAALEAQESLKLRGFTSSCGPTGGVVIDRWSHVRGVWHFHAPNYFWIPAGSTEPSYRTGSLPHAVDYTLTVISKT